MRGSDQASGTVLPFFASCSQGRLTLFVVIPITVKCNASERFSHFLSYVLNCTDIHLVQFEVDHSMSAVATAMQTAFVSRGFEVKYDPSPRTTAERSVANLTAQL